MSVTQATPAEIAQRQKTAAAWEQAQRDILPAILVDSKSNGQRVSAFLLDHNLPPTASNLYHAINHVYAELKWVVKPAKLKRDEDAANTYVRNQRDAGTEQSIQDKAKSAEATRLKKIADERVVADTLILIGKFAPVNRFGKPLLGHAAEIKEMLLSYVRREVEANHSRESIYRQVSDFLSKEYDRLEKDASGVR